MNEVNDQYADVCNSYTEALLRSRRSSLILIQAAVIKGWTSAEIEHYVNTGEQPPGKELE